MGAYVVSLLLGVVGFSAMAVSGLARHSHGGRAGSGRGGRAHAHRGGSRAAGSRAANHLVLALTSPRFVFSVAMGLGLTGIILHPLAPRWTLPFLALGGGLLFERVLVGPVWDALMRFASEPALTLESCTGDDATAVTAFDGRGHGIVSIELDGQVVHLLATLQGRDRVGGPRVTAGTRLHIEDVDAVRNRCSVSRR